jgi:glycosyltransferase involved in cell wall biosynthesis
VLPGVTGDLVPPRRPDLLAASLRALLAEPERRWAFGKAGRERVERFFSWDRVVGLHERAYAEVVAERSDAAFTEVLGSAR